MSQKRMLRRYRNRKLYDLQQGYVGLAQVAQMVRAGQDVEVVDHVTKEDRTGHVLAQALAQEELRAPNPNVRQKLVEALRLVAATESPQAASANG